MLLLMPFGLVSREGTLCTAIPATFLPHKKNKLQETVRRLHVNLLCLETKASWLHVEAAAHKKRITSAGTAALWNATPAAQTSGEKASPSHEKHTQFVSLRYLYIRDTASAIRVTPLQPATVSLPSSTSVT